MVDDTFNSRLASFIQLVNSCRYSSLLIESVEAFSSYNHDTANHHDMYFVLEISIVFVID